MSTDSTSSEPMPQTKGADHAYDLHALISAFRSSIALRFLRLFVVTCLGREMPKPGKDGRKNAQGAIGRCRHLCSGYSRGGGFWEGRHLERSAISDRGINIPGRELALFTTILGLQGL